MQRNDFIENTTISNTIIQVHNEQYTQIPIKHTVMTLNNV